jgi:hypothetical protein
MAELIASFAGIILSLLAAYVPGFSDWFASLDGTRKRLFMLAACVASAFGIIGAGCAGWYDYPCTDAGIKEVGGALIAALVANQAAYVMAVRQDVSAHIDPPQ